MNTSQFISIIFYSLIDYKKNIIINSFFTSDEYSSLSIKTLGLPILIGYNSYIIQEST